MLPVLDVQVRPFSDHFLCTKCHSSLEKALGATVVAYYAIFRTKTPFSLAAQGDL
jgi:hypothetical protein